MLPTTLVLALVTLQTQFADIARTLDGTVGIYARVLESGEAAGLNDAGRFPMQSVYKLPIAMAVLSLVDAHRLRLDHTVHVSKTEMVPRVHSPIRDAHPGGVDLSVRNLIRATIVDSDGTASDVLLRLAGGPGKTTAYLRGLGIHGMTIATTEREMSEDMTAQYRNASTPRAAVDLLAALHRGRGLSSGSRALLLQDLADSTPGAKRLKGLLPAGTPVAHKTGTDSTRHGRTAATNDIGLITLPDGRHLAISVFVRDSGADEAARESTIARAARAAWDHWTAAR